MNAGAPETHLVLVWDRARHALDRILADATRRFVVRDVVEVTWQPERFRRSLSRLYGTDLPPNSNKERESGTGPFVVIVVDDEQPRTIARKTQHGWFAANAALLAAKQRYRRWASGSYRVHTTLTPVETRRDAVLLLGDGPEVLRQRTWNRVLRTRRQDLLGDPVWRDVDELRAALVATMPCALLPRRRPSEPLEVVTNDAWWAIRIIDPPTAEGLLEPEERLRRPTVAGNELPVLVRDVSDADADPAWTNLLSLGEQQIRPTAIDRLATMARLRS